MYFGDLLVPIGGWGHYPAGEHRDVRIAAKLKAMGVQRGWPDFILLDPAGRMHALELKRIGETLTDDQEAFHAWCIAQGIPRSVAQTVDEVLAVLNAWDVLRYKIGEKSSR